MALYIDLKDCNEEILDKKAIDNALKNILSTRKGSLPGKPEFGCDIDRFLFEPLDHTLITLIQTVIAEAIFNYEPRIQIDDILIEQQSEYYRLIITIYYHYTFIKTVDMQSTRITING